MTKALTRFGATALSLAIEQLGTQKLKDIAEVMEAPEGKEVSSKSLSRWFRGINAPPDWLPRSLSTALELNERQNMRLAYAFAFGADLYRE